MTSINGDVPVVFIAPVMALGFAVRAVGNVVAHARGEWGMPWGARVFSWLCLGFAAVLLGMAGSIFSVAACAAFVVLDAASGFVKREAPDRPARRTDLRPFWIGLGIAVYLGLVAAFYLLVGRYFVYGVLVSWALLGFGFALLLRLTLVGAKAGEAWLAPPRDHRVHERREAVVIDPQRARAERILVALRARGDATPLLEMVGEAARNADLPEEELRAMEGRIVSALARAGTRRDEDILSALAEVERILALRSRPLEVPIPRPKEVPS